MEIIRSKAVGFNAQKYSYTRILSWMLNHPKTIFGTLALITIVLGLQIPHLILRFSIYDLIIEKTPETRSYHRHVISFGPDEIIRIVFKTHNIYYPTVFNKIDHVAKALARIPGVEEVISLPHMKRAIELSSSMNLDRFRQVADKIELFQNHLIFGNGKVTSVILILAKGVDRNAVVKQATELLKQEKIGTAAYMTGRPFFNHIFGRLIQREFFLFALLFFFLSALTLFLLQRNIASVVLIFSCIFLSLIWTLGLMALLELPLSLLTFIALMFLLGVQITYCLNVIAICTDAYKTATTNTEAVIIGFSRVPLPLILSVAITLFGLLSFLFNPIDVINEFGIFIYIGMLIFLFLIFTFLPVGLLIFPISDINTRFVKDSKTSWPHHLTNLISLKQNHRRFVVPVFFIITIICLVGIIRINIETNPLEIFKLKSRIVKKDNEIHQNFPKNFPIRIALKAPDNNFFLDPLNVKKIDHLQNFIESLPGVNQTLSFADYIKLSNYTINGFHPEDYSIPKDSLEMVKLADSSKNVLSKKALQTYMNPDFSKAHIVVFTQLTNSNQIDQICEAVWNHTDKSAFLDFKVDFTGIGMAISTGAVYLTYGQFKSLGLTLIMVFGILWFLLISLKVSMIAMVPIIFPIIFTFGLVCWFGMEITMFTNLIATIAVSLAVGNVMHYIVRYHCEFKKDLDYSRAMQVTIDSVGSPIIYGTVSVGVGFSILYFSNFIPFSVFGLMMILTMLATLFTNLLLLPIFLRKFELVTMWDLFRLKLGKSPDINSPLFNGLSTHQIRSILMAGTLQKLTPREVLFQKGDKSDTMYAIVSGSIDIINFHRYEDTSGVHEIQKVVNQLYSGDVVGEMGFFRSTRRSATAVAIENTELLQINWSIIRRLQWLYPLIAQKFFINLMGIICDRLEKMTNTLCDQSLIDDLTGLFNKKGFTQLLNTETRRAQRYHEELAICLICLDLKDKISSADPKTTKVMIRTVCQMLSSEIRRTDILSRIDANTFAMVAPKTSKSQANILCQRLNQVLHRNLLCFSTPNMEVRLAVTNLICDKKETAMDFLERGISKLQSAQE
jgi:diguanylate cyclase (GGDEF)-like protein